MPGQIDSPTAAGPSFPAVDSLKGEHVVDINDSASSSSATDESDPVDESIPEPSNNAPQDGADDDADNEPSSLLESSADSTTEAGSSADKADVDPSVVADEVITEGPATDLQDPAAPPSAPEDAEKAAKEEEAKTEAIKKVYTYLADNLYANHKRKEPLFSGGVEDVLNCKRRKMNAAMGFSNIGYSWYSARILEKVMEEEQRSGAPQQEIDDVQAQLEHYYSRCGENLNIIRVRAEAQLRREAAERAAKAAAEAEALARGEPIPAPTPAPAPQKKRKVKGKATREPVPAPAPAPAPQKTNRKKKGKTMRQPVPAPAPAPAPQQTKRKKKGKATREKVAEPTVAEVDAVEAVVEDAVATPESNPESGATEPNAEATTETATATETTETAEANAVEQQEQQEPTDWVSLYRNALRSMKQSTGPNEKCPCGSRQKYKKCCANVGGQLKEKKKQKRFSVWENVDKDEGAAEGVNAPAVEGAPDTEGLPTLAGVVDLSC